MSTHNICFQGEISKKDSIFELTFFKAINTFLFSLLLIKSLE